MLGRGRSKSSVAVAIVAGSLVLAGCGSSASPTVSAVVASPANASAPVAGSPSGSASEAPSASAATGPSASPASLGRLPIGRIVFDRLDGGPEGDLRGLFTLGTDGQEQEVKLSQLPEFAYAVWSSDGRKLLLNAFLPSTGASVGILDPASDKLVPIAPKDLGTGLDCSDWSPDDATIVCGYSSDEKTADGIYTVDVASGRATRLTESPFHDTVGSAGECGGGENRGVYSPDGKHIAFEQQKCGTGPDPSSDELGSIVVIAADGSSPKVAVPFGGVRTHPGGEISWSPNGRLIAFGSQEGVLSVIAPDGKGLRTLAVPDTQNGSVAYGPAWSPDGRWLLVSIGSHGVSDLWAIAADGSKSIQLTADDPAEAYTDWTAAGG